MGEWFSEVWRCREILYFLAWRDVKVRYKQAALGVGWAVLQPLFTMVTFTVFFGKLAGIPSSGIPYPLFSYSALLLWTYFSVTLSQVGNSLVANSSLITKIYFPRVLLPAAAALGGILDLLVGSVLLVAMMVYYRVSPSWSLLLTPLFVAQTVLLVLGAGMLLASLNVRYRDVKYTIPFIIQIGLFVTPIIYPVTFIPQALRNAAGVESPDGHRRGIPCLPVRCRRHQLDDRRPLVVHDTVAAGARRAALQAHRARLRGHRLRGGRS